MSVARTPDGGYKVRWRDALGVHRAKTFPGGRGDEARKYERQKRWERDHGHDALPDSKATLLEVGEDFKRVVIATKAPKTQASYKSLWNKHLSWEFGPHRMTHITPGHIEEWLASADVGVPTKRKAIALLSQIYKFAMKRGIVAANPCDLADLPSYPMLEPVHPPTPLQVEQIRKAFLEHGRQREAILVSVMAYAGLRPRSEALALRWADVGDRTLLVRAPKTKTFRPVELLPPLAQDLATYRPQFTLDTAYLFPNREGDYVSQTTYDNWRERVWDKTVPNHSPKDLRHTYVSLLMRDESYSRAHIAALTGHSLEIQDRVYAHVWAELRGTGDATEAIREARAEVFGIAQTGKSHRADGGRA